MPSERAAVALRRQPRHRPAEHERAGRLTANVVHGHAPRRVRERLRERRRARARRACRRRRSPSARGRPVQAGDRASQQNPVARRTFLARRAFRGQRRPGDREADGRVEDGIDRRTFLRVAGAGAAAATVWRPGAEALAARTRAAAARPERARHRARLAAPRLRRRIRQHVDQNADDRRARAREPALHARVPGGDADGPRAPLADDGPPRLPVARLAPDAQPARLARLDRPRRGHDDVAQDAAPARLLDRLRDRQPVPRLRARVGAASARRSTASCA